MPKKNKAAKTKEGLKIPGGAKQYLSFDEKGTELWEIENIIEQRESNGKKEYLVKWRGWPYRFCTWEPEESFLEDMDIILRFVEQLNQNKKRVYNPIKKMEKPKKVTPKKVPTKKPIKRTPAPKKVVVESSDETKIVIQKIKLPPTTQPTFTQSDSTSNFWIPDKSIGNPNGTIPSPTKPNEIFVCANANDDTTTGTQIHTDETDINGPDPQQNGIYWNSIHHSAPPRMQDSDDELENYPSSRKREEIEAEKLTELISCPFQIKTLQRNASAPLMENDLENLENYKIVIEEGFTYSKGFSSQPGSFRFKVAFYDSENHLRGYDYFSYDEIQQKSWHSSLLEFFTQEILSQLSKNKRSLTKNIKVI